MKDLLRALIARDMKLRYRGSLLGMAWTLLNPLAELLVLLFIFSAVLPLNIPNYGAFLLSGLLANSWFQSGLSFATVSVVNNRELIRRPDVPSTILPVISVASTLVHFALSLPVLFVLLLVNHVQLTTAVFALPLVIGVQFVLILAFAYPLAALHVWFRDTQYLLKVALQLMFYLTPIFYDRKTIPPRFATLYMINPMVSIVDGYREILLRGRLPQPMPLLIVSVVSSIVLVFGVVLFRRASYRFADEL